ncbi:MAG: response regulator [Mucilaginibacter sp.]|nr:response regulator [Mucilaginibacter sp.]
MSGKGKKILVVDDDDDIRFIIKMILYDEGYVVTELNSGHEVVSEVDRLHPDVILLDAMLGDMDGRDICKALKSHAATTGIPVIIVSATHGSHTMHQKLCMANDYIDKPFEITELVDKVRLYSAA